MSSVRLRRLTKLQMPEDKTGAVTNRLQDHLREVLNPALQAVEDATSGAVYGVPVEVRSGPFAVPDRNGVYAVDCSAGAVRLGLPSATLGRIIVIAKIDAGPNAVIVSASGSQTIIGGATATIGTQWTSIHLIGYSAGWLLG